MDGPGRSSDAGDAVAGRFVVLGSISGIYGVRGRVRVRSYTQPPQKLADYLPWWSRSGAAGHWRPLPVGTVCRTRSGLQAELEGIQDRDQARRLIGLELGVPRAQLPPLSPGEFYWCDLLGLQALNCNGEALGRVTRILQTEAHGVLQIDGSREYLVPLLLRSHVQEVNLEAGTIRVNWQEPG